MRHAVANDPHWIACENYVARSPHVALNLTRINKKIADKRREQFDLNCRQMFRKRCGRMCSAYQIHHVIPICLGGGNGYDNLVLCEPVLHRAIHRVIDLQMRGMLEGESRLIRIPTLPARIWIGPR